MEMLQLFLTKIREFQWQRIEVIRSKFVLHYVADIIF